MKRQNQLRPYLYVLPMLVFALLFTYYPFARTLRQAFSVVNARGEVTAFAGLANFEYLFSRREFAAALGNTLWLTLLNVPITIAITLLLAALCAPKRRTGAVSEMLFSLPMAVSMSAVTLIFGILLNPTVGYINHAMGLKIGWFQDRNTALYGILIITVWMGIGFNFLLFLAAFRGIPVGTLEAAKLDGANAAQLMWHVQLPQIVPAICYVLCTNTVQCLMTSGPVMILTQGGPSRATTTLIYMMYTSGYGSSNYSVAACVSIVTFGIALAFTAAALYLEDKR